MYELAEDAATEHYLQRPGVMTSLDLQLHRVSRGACDATRWVIAHPAETIELLGDHLVIEVPDAEQIRRQVVGELGGSEAARALVREDPYTILTARIIDAVHIRYLRAIPSGFDEQVASAAARRYPRQPGPVLLAARR